jgi:hypothetical protein
MPVDEEGVEGKVEDRILEGIGAGPGTVAEVQEIWEANVEKTHIRWFDKPVLTLAEGGRWRGDGLPPPRTRPS